MTGLAVTLLMVTFFGVLIFPPSAAILVPGCSIFWIVAYLARKA